MVMAFDDIHRSLIPLPPYLNVPWHPGICCTFPFTKTTMSTNSPSSGQFPCTGARVDSDGFADDESIGNEFADGLARVCVGDFINFIGIEPDLALATSNDGGRKTFLGTEVDPIRRVFISLTALCRNFFAVVCGDLDMWTSNL